MVYQMTARGWCFDDQFVYPCRILALVRLGYAPDTHQGVGIAPQHELLQRGDFLEVARLCRPKDTLPQITNVPVGPSPVDGVPVSRSRGSVCCESLTYLTFPAIGNCCCVLWVVCLVHVSRLSAWV